MPHRHVLKDAYWKMRIEHPYSMAAACDDLAATCGQPAIGETGEVLFPGDLPAQSRQVIETQKKIFGDLGIAEKDLTKVVIFTSERGHEQLRDCEALFRSSAPDGVPVFCVVIPPLFYDDLLTEVDFYATPPQAAVGAVPMLLSLLVEVEIGGAEPAFSDALGDAAFTMLANALAQKGLAFENIVKLSCFAPTDKSGFWQALAAHRRGWFKSGLRAISDVVSEPRRGGQRLQLDATCIARDIEPSSILPVGQPLERGHPEALLAGPLLFTSALFSPHEPQATIEEEVTSIMERHTALLQSVGMSFAGVIKANTFYEGSGSAEALHQNMQVRNAYYRVPGPASTGLPVSAFPYPGKRTSIELIAARP